jgi:hypothetical protein
MKLILLITIILLPYTIIAQTLKVDTAMISNKKSSTYLLLDTVVQSNLSKLQLYSNATSFLANSFKDSRVVIENKDSDLGEIIFSGSIGKRITEVIIDKKGRSSTHTNEANLLFKCKLYFKDNKFKVILSSLEYPFSGYLTGVNFPLSLPKDKEEPYIIGARELAYTLIKDISKSINSKPLNDF